MPKETEDRRRPTRVASGIGQKLGRLVGLSKKGDETTNEASNLESKEATSLPTSRVIKHRGKACTACKRRKIVCRAPALGPCLTCINRGIQDQCTSAPVASVPSAVAPPLTGTMPLSLTTSLDDHQELKPVEPIQSNSLSMYPSSTSNIAMDSSMQSLTWTSPLEQYQASADAQSTSISRKGSSELFRRSASPPMLYLDYSNPSFGYGLPSYPSYQHPTSTSINAYTPNMYGYPYYPPAPAALPDSRYPRHTRRYSFDSFGASLSRKGSAESLLLSETGMVNYAVRNTPTPPPSMMQSSFAPMPSSSPLTYTPYHPVVPPKITAAELPGDVADLTGQVRYLSLVPTFDGTYSSIFRGEHRGSAVAIKVIRVVKDIPAMRRKIRRETGAWSLMSHPNILPLLGFMETPGLGEFGGLVSPWCDNGSAAHYLSTKPPIQKRLNTLRQVSKGIQYLHEHVPVIVHGDLKLANIVIDGDLNAKLCDFGLVRLIQDQITSGMTTTTAHTGTARYLAYELVELDGLPTTESDMHALGCIAMEFVTFSPPYAHIGTHQPNAHFKICREIAIGKPPALPPSSSPNEQVSSFWSFLEDCWDKDTTRRPIASEAVEYFDGLGVEFMRCFEETDLLNEEGIQVTSVGLDSS